MGQKPSADNKAIAKIAFAAFGGAWKVGGYLDELDRASLDVVTAEETPNQGLKSFCTIGLSDYPIPGGGVTPPLGTELVGTSCHEEFANVLATAGFFVINDGWIAEPDRLFHHIVSEHFDDVTTPHLLLVEPYLWTGLDPVEMSTKTVAFVMAVPVTEAERLYFHEHGSDGLGDALERADPDIIDLWRESVV